jgi:hypothetical protein
VGFAAAPADAAGTWHWGPAGIYRGQNPYVIENHLINDGIADPNVNYWTPFWQHGSDPNTFLPVGQTDTSYRNEFAVNHDINAEFGIPLLGYIDIFTPLFHTNELAIAATISSVWSSVVNTVSSVWSSITSIFQSDYSSYSSTSSYSDSGFDNAFDGGFSGYDGGGGGGGGGCFVAGTPVTMADGSTRPIESVRAGDLVLTYDTRAKQPAVSEVTQAVIHDHWKERAATVLINGTLRATVNHPFFVNGHWQRADQLKVGDVLVRALPAGREAAQPVRATSVLGARGAEPAPLPSIDTIKVRSIEQLPGADTVYNLEVAKHHDFFSGGVLVHNVTLECF